MIKQKLTSRKFWIWVFATTVAIAGFVSGNIDANAALAGIMAAAAAYQLGEGLADSKKV